jgi:LPS export ABC transporter protein LptC
MSPRRVGRALALSGAVVLAVILIISVTVVWHRETRQALTKAAGLMPGALLHAHNFHWTQMKGDQSQWVLKAKDASYAADKSSLILADAELSMTAKDGRHMALVAPRARLRLEGNHISGADLSGGLVVHYGEFVLTTEKATFAPDADQLEAPGPVSIQGPNVSVNGVGLTGHPKAEVFNLLKQVSTRIVPRQRSALVKGS